MYKKFTDIIDSSGLLEGVENVTVAFSGGADSTALLHLMMRAREYYGINLTAAHLNHGVRGQESDRDEEFVRELCIKWGIDLFCEKTDAPAIAKARKISIELACRQARYEFLSRVAKGVVATAHNANDNLETMLLNFTRGTALKGLCGIPVKRDIFIRPLLSFTRDEIERYCRENGLEYVTDSTNLSDDYTRNLIRHKVVPVLKQINPSVEAAAARLSSVLADDEAVLEESARKLLSRAERDDGGLSAREIVRAGPAVGRRAVSLYLKKEIPDACSYLHIKSVYDICASSGRVSLPCDREAVVYNGVLRLPLYGDNSSGDRILVRISETVNDLFTKDKKINNLLLKNSLDCDKIVGQLVTRVRMPEDKMRIYNRKGTKSLKKIYNEYRIPPQQRKNLPVIADDEGIVWICGVGVAERCAVTENTKRILRIETAGGVNQSRGS